MQVPLSRSDKLKVRDESPIHLTEEAFKRLKERLARLQKSLPSLIIETQTAAAHGDRSENAEYQLAKSALRRTHRQILIVKDQIRRVVVIKPGPNTSGRVQLGSTVVLDKDGLQQTFQIVGPYETDPARGRISNQSPLGAALMKHAKGDAVTIQTVNGSQKYQIIEIR